MRLLPNSKQINKEVTRLIDECDTCQIAVAWATMGFDACNRLIKNRQKIDRMVVGTHFFQTHPDFIREFREHARVRFVKKTDGVFHPKLYLFEMNTTKWECIVGSANFTNGGFDTNDEMAVLFTSEDRDSEDSFAQGKRSIRAYWDKAVPFSDDDYNGYKHQCELFRKQIKTLSGQFGDPNSTKGDKGRHPTDIPELSMSWKKYFDHVKNEPARTKDEKEKRMKGRLAVIEEAQRLFKNIGHFIDMDTLGRKKIAGIVGKVGEVDFGWFGYMTVAGKFSAVVNNAGGKHATDLSCLSRALDAIPLFGDVNRERYMIFIDCFKEAFPKPKGGGGVGTASRLLAMKRPDVFVCVDRANREAICRQHIGISPNTLDYYKYWDSIIARVTQSSGWYSSPPPKDKTERRVWDARVAFFDSICYKKGP